MVILVSNIATDHCHQSVTRKYSEKKWPTVISSAPTSVFASPAFVYAYPPVFFGFSPVFFGASPVNP